MKSILNIWISIILLKVLVIKSEDPLQHLRWRKGNMDDPKPWFLYITKWLERRMWKRISMTRLLSYLETQLENFNSKLQHNVTVCNNYISQNSITVTDPTQFYSSQCHPGFSQLKIEWKFSVHAQMRLNITLYSIKARDVFGHCMGNNVIVQSREVNFVFCGRYSTFNVYPPYREVVFKVNFGFQMIFQTGFSLISKNIVFNKEVQKGYDFTTPIFIHDIIAQECLLYTYRIIVNKYEVLYFDLRITKVISPSTSMAQDFYPKNNVF